MATQEGKRTRSGSRRKPAEQQATRQEQVRDLAYEIYETRRTTGMLGDPVSDWLEAESRLSASPGRGSRRSASRA